ncbi:MAG: DNA methyltransferase, partial [Treponemataceae bacterium]|nr:DNA methyltransferase [Treponemataceae bacterium]
MAKVMTLKTEQLHKSSSQIVSKKRVAEHGEVYTAEREVKAMCDLVNDETQRLDSRFLEPACGTGNFLVEILNRKLEILKSKYKNTITDFEKYSVVAVGSLYGVELLSDNVEVCRNRLFDLWKNAYYQTFKNKINTDFEKVIQFVLHKN